MSCLNITQHFDKYFQLIVANTAELKQEVFSIRYQVYCEELNFEPAENFPDGLEKDIYDERSIHYLLQHRPTGKNAGCVRVVLPEQKNPEAILPLESLFPDHFDLNNRFRTNFCEVSRLAVLSQFRKRKGESKIPEGLIFTPSDNHQIGEKRQFPVIALSLYWVSIGTGPLVDLEVMALIQPRLARHLKRCGIITHQIGDLVEYHGWRGLYQIEAKKFHDNLRDDVRELFEFIDAERKSQLCYKPQKSGNNTISNEFRSIIKV